jgi:hypothetical protein
MVAGVQLGQVRAIISGIWKTENRQIEAKSRVVINVETNQHISLQKTSSVDFPSLA